MHNQVRCWSRSVQREAIASFWASEFVELRRYANANHFRNRESVVGDIGVLLQQDVWDPRSGLR